MAGAADKPAIVVTGGDNGHGEVVRGDVLLIHYDEAEESISYAEEMLAAAKDAEAPQAVIDSLQECIDDQTVFLPE